MESWDWKGATKKILTYICYLTNSKKLTEIAGPSLPFCEENVNPVIKQRMHKGWIFDVFNIGYRQWKLINTQIFLNTRKIEKENLSCSITTSLSHSKTSKNLHLTRTCFNINFQTKSISPRPLMPRPIGKDHRYVSICISFKNITFDCSMFRDN